MLSALAAVRFALGFVALPESVLPFVNHLVGAIFLGVPLLAVTVASEHPWTKKLAGGCVGVGFALHLGCTLLDLKLFKMAGVGHGFLMAVGQIGMPIWCAGLGALIATSIKDRNLLVPVSIFLICFDIFLVLSPNGFTGRIARNSPQVLSAVAAQVPQIVSHHTGGAVSPGQLAGPADFVFLAMFMIALYRFGLRAKEMSMAVIPVLVCYMFIVEWLAAPLPALVPIGLCLIATNRREFKLTKDEAASTIVLTIICVGVLGYVFKSKTAVKEPQPEPLPRAIDRVPQAPAGSPAQAPRG